MAHKFEKGKHIYFLFENGHTVQDSQLKPRYYLERKKAEEYLPYGDEIVEYAPVVHGEWKPVKYMTHCSCGKSYETYHYECSVCKRVAYRQPYGLNFCPHCGAKMDGERKGDDAVD